MSAREHNTTPPADHVSLCRPDWLYNVVVDYAGFGAHLTGTDAVRSTADWLTNLIFEIGGTATLEPFALAAGRRFLDDADQ